MRTLSVLLQKEFRQLARNKFVPKVIVLFPIMVMLVIPWVTTMDVRNVGVTVVDDDRSTLSRRLVDNIDASEYLSVIAVCDDYAAALALLEAGETDAILEIPDDCESSLLEGRLKKMNISANGVNAMKGSLGSRYLMGAIAQTLAEVQAEKGLPASVEPTVVRNFYNPTLEYRNYMVPALMIMLLVMICGFLPALNLVGEKETGTIEQINVTPVGRFTFTLAKLIPFWLVGLVVLSIAMLLAWGVYALSPASSVAGIYAAALLFVLTMSGLGVAIANKSDTMQQAMFVMFFIVIIFILMSGLLTPIDSMPAWAQKITLFLPPRYFIEIMQSIYLKGATFNDLWHDFAALGVFAVVFDLIAVAAYKKRS